MRQKHYSLVTYLQIYANLMRVLQASKSNLIKHETFWYLFPVAEHSFQVPMPNSPLLFNY